MSAFISIIDALAWPASVLIIAFLFRREVRGVLTRLGQFKYGGVEMTFHNNLRDAEVLAEAITTSGPTGEAPGPARVQLEVGLGDATELAGTLVGHESPTATTVLIAGPRKAHPPTARKLDSFLALCARAPSEAVRETWIELQGALLAAAAGVGDRRAPAPVQVEGAVRFLIERGWLASTEGHLVERLQRLNDQVERPAGASISRDEARRFVNLAVPMINRLLALGIAG